MRRSQSVLLTLLITAPISCAHEGEGEVSDAQGCGDGIVDEDEYCDAGGETPVCDDDCTPVECGDGNVNDSAGEEFDGGAVEDGCTDECLLVRRVVFVTSDTKSGDFGGPAGADQVCQKHAAGKGLAGTYMAWLSNEEVGPATRFGTSPAFIGRFELVDGTLVAAGWAGLTSGALAHPINLDEEGTKVEWGVWTGTTTSGTPMDTPLCQGWTSGSVAESGGIGYSAKSDGAWTEGATNTCSSSLRLYCVQVLG